MDNACDNDRYSVIIVGAGVAGLAAANILSTASKPFLLIEAQDYAGGRVKSIRISDDIVIDLGAQFIHGEKDNKIYELCKQLDCVVGEEEENDEFFLTSECKQIDSEIAQQMWDLREEVLDEAREITQTDKLFGDFLRENYEKRVPEIISNANLSQAFVEWFVKIETEDNGCQNLNEVSLSEFGTFETLDGDYMRPLKRGFQPLIDLFLSAIPKNQLMLNSEVVQVEYLVDNHMVAVSVIDHLNDKVRCILCNHLIWTTSIGYLKENFLRIFKTEKQLIEKKKAAIDNLGFGTLNKIVLIYADTMEFWPNNVAGVYLLQLPRAPVTLSEDQICFLSTHKVDSVKAQSIIDAMIYMCPSAGLRTISFLIAGPAAFFVEEIDEHVLGLLCHDVLCHYLNIKSTKENQPVRAVRSEWKKNPYIRGSFSFLSVQSTRHDQECLREPYAPDGIPRIVFAGEASHEQYFSTVHGAFESGSDAAKYITRSK